MSQSRQLAAIMFTDIVGYTAMMGEDENKAFELLDKNRNLHKPIIKEFNGQWIKELGDGVMASFYNVSDAVNAAIKIQEGCKLLNEFSLRIGIHLGEVVFEQDDVYGDGVNIASRLQAVAIPGSIYISEAVHDNIANKKNIRTEFVQVAELKNVKKPVRIYQVTGNQVVDKYAPGRNLLNKDAVQSIAVLPFVNMSNDAEQEYFCDGISEEIMNSLAQLEKLRVVARTSAFAFKNKNLDVREIGKILNVKTLLEGSVRKAGNNLRITTQLVQVADGTYLWSNRYDRVLEDVFAIQADIAESVVTALRGFLTIEEKEAIRRPETNVEAYDYFLKGRELFHQLALKEAETFYKKAITLDPDYALAYAGLADVYSWIYEWEGGSAADLEAAENNSRMALALAPQLSESHSSRGFVLALAKRYQQADQEFQEAIRLNSNSFDAHYLYGRAAFAHGETEKSAQMLRRASEIRPEDYQSMLLLEQSERVLGKDGRETLEEGIRRAKEQFKLNPDDRRLLSLGSTSLYEFGEKEAAFEWINRAMKLYPEDAGVLINGTCLFAKANEKEKALGLLEKAVDKGFGKKDWIEHDPDYDNLREEPRFKALLLKLQ